MKVSALTGCSGKPPLYAIVPRAGVSGMPRGADPWVGQAAAEWSRDHHIIAARDNG